MLALSVGWEQLTAVILYMAVLVYLGYLGHKRTKTASDYLIAGRATHPFVMAMSYGATFISTSAIVGFGGVAGLFGMSLLWLVFLNVFVGIFIAFVFLGGRTRRMGHRLDAHTFPELLGKRYDSRSIQALAGVVILGFIPLYAAAVMIGGCKFLEEAFRPDLQWVGQFLHLPPQTAAFNVALILFTVVVGVYVLLGGLKAVMYTDAFQGTIMTVGMVVLLVFVYVKIGGVVEGHRHLTELAPLVPPKLQAIGHQGWTSTPRFGFGGNQYNLWWTVFSTIVLGVGIGVLAQPQLVVRFMTVKSQKDLNRGVISGGIFILLIPGTAYLVGSLSNSYFAEHGDLRTGRVLRHLSQAAPGQAADAQVGRHAEIQLMTHDPVTGRWIDVPGKTVAVLLERETPGSTPPLCLDKDGKSVEIVHGRGIAIYYAKGDLEQIIPTFITSAMPSWFGVVFLLVLLAAAMSTMSSQFHTLGSCISRDVCDNLAGRPIGSIALTRSGVLIGIVVSVGISVYARDAQFIARGTAIFFGVCASCFLPAFVGGLFWRGATKAGAIASMLAGAVVSLGWLALVKGKEAKAIGIVQSFLPQDVLARPNLPDEMYSLLRDHPNWPSVDQVLIALPISILIFVLVSRETGKPPAELVNHCFSKERASEA